jgi:hypothetical protein
MQRGSDPATRNREKWSNQLANLRSSLERNKRSGDSPEVVDFDRRTVVTLFT